MATIRNKAGAELTVLPYGATIQRLLIPDREGVLRDVVLGYDREEDYAVNGDYVGATIGRVGNRIGGACFSLNGKEYRLEKNDGENQLHGGHRGFDKQIWDTEISGNRVICRRLSPDGEEHYPGNLAVQVEFELTEENDLVIRYDADTDADTPVNLTNHSYFNLNGEGSILNHRLTLYAEKVTANGQGCLPTGRFLPVEGTALDFREEKALGRNIDADEEQIRLVGGYDINYVLSGKKAAVLWAPESGIEMTVETDLPGTQLYTANFLRERIGKGGRAIGPRSAVCLETQLFPNAMRCYSFPSPILHAGEHLHSETAYRFRIR